MYRKNCDKCCRPSYSSDDFGEWLCPVCGNNLTKSPFFDAITFEQLPIKPFDSESDEYTRKY